MNEFEFWQDWGKMLGDKEFANAYTALGILAATSGKKVPETGTGLIIPAETDLNNTLKSLISDYSSGKTMLTWQYPAREDHFKTAKGHILLTQLSPSLLAKSWKNVFSDFNSIKLCLKVKEYPVAENINPWFRILFESDPELKAVFLDFENPGLTSASVLPLRLGLLPPTADKITSGGIFASFPINKISDQIDVKLDFSNCNVLIFKGNASLLYRTLTEAPQIEEVKLFIVKGKSESCYNNNEWLIPEIAQKCKTGGFIFIDPGINDDQLVQAINKFNNNLVRSYPAAFAAGNAFSGSFQTDPVIFMTQEFAGFQSEYLTGRKEKMIPPKIDKTLEQKYFEEIRVPKMAETIRGDDKAMAEVYEKITEKEHSEETDEADKFHQRRYLQEQVYIIKDKKTIREERVFLKDSRSEIRVRIGLPEKEWTSIQESFPEEKLPKDLKEWKLIVVLTEPDHLAKALRRSITLKKQGSSTECKFRFKVADKPVFEGRVSVLHRGRVLQTGLIYGRVVSDLDETTAKDKISFAETVEVRSHIGYLQNRRKFDLAFILNHTSDKRPRLTAISSRNAWCKDLSAAKAITVDINTSLSEIADSVEDFKGDIFQEKNRELIVKLAKLGHILYWSIVEEQLKVTGTRPGILDKENIQIITTNPDSILPFEFIYDQEVPDNDAEPCSSWIRAFDDDSCRSGCRIDKRKFVCPLGFWAIKKVFERHDITPELADKGDYYIQSEPVKGRRVLSLKGSVVAGASENVEEEDFAPVLETIKAQMSTEPLMASSWDDWAHLVTDNRPNVLIALTHTDGNGIDAKLEIGGSSIESIRIREDHVRPEGEKGYPLVMLLGCDTSGTALEYGSHVQWFRRRGAGVVIGTIATVFGGHAAIVAEMLVKNLKKRKKNMCLGQVIRAVKREALQKGMIMPLCIVAYGDADWRLN